MLTGTSESIVIRLYGPELEVLRSRAAAVAEAMGGIDGVADLLAAEFAIAGDAPIETVMVNISGVVSVEAYGSVQAILKEITLIEGFAISEVAGDKVTYRVEVRGGPERLGRALRFSGLVEQEDSDPVLSGALEFFYGP